MILPIVRSRVVLPVLKPMGVGRSRAVISLSIGIVVFPVEVLPVVKSKGVLSRVVLLVSPVIELPGVRSRVVLSVEV